MAEEEVAEEEVAGVVVVVAVQVVARLGEEPQQLQISHDVGELVGHQQDHQVLDRLVDVAHLSRLDGVVLLVRADQLGEGGQQVLDPHPRHLNKLACDQHLAPLGEHRRGEAHHASCGQARHSV